MAQIVTIGEILVEVMAAEVNQTFLSPGFFRGPYPSGAPAIMIDQAARLGASCAIIACVGDDDFGKLNIERLRGDGVDVRGIVVKRDETTGVAFVGYTQDGNRKFIFHFSHAAAGALQPEDLSIDVFEDIRVFHVMGCSLSASASLRETVLKGARIARERGALLSFDPNIRPELLGDYKVREAFSQILRQCDILLTSKDEMVKIAGADCMEGANSWKQYAKLAVILKDGRRGARLITQDTDVRIPSFPVQEVDPTGAGDCFDGAFLASFISGKSLYEAAKIGNAAGALGVTKYGPMEGAAQPMEIAALTR